MTEQTTPQIEQPMPEQTEQRPVVTLAIVKAKFNTELTRHQYQAALDRFSKLVVTTENTGQVQETMKKVRGFIKTLGDIKDNGKKPALDEGRMWDRAYADILTPLQQILTSKSNELQIILDKIAEENRKKEKERLRVEGIKKEIDNFVLQTSQTIATSTTPDEIVTVEKLIGSHKANKSRYQEFLPDLVERCNELVPLIKKQKEHIKDLLEIERQKKEAETKGDDRTLLELQEKGELIQNSIDETKINIQEDAIRQATRPDAVTTLQPMQQDIKYRRQSWKWEVKEKDVKELYKKMPHLVDLVPNKEKIDDLIKFMKTDGSLKDKEEVIINGLRIYLEKLA